MHLVCHCQPEGILSKLKNNRLRELETAEEGERGRQRGMNGWMGGESEGRWRQRREGEVLMNGLMAH